MYTPLEWLESSGSNPNNGNGAVISTGINPYKVKTEIKFMQRHVNYNTGLLQGVCGCWNTNNQRYYVCNMINNSTNNLYYVNRSNQSTLLMSSDFTNPHTIIYNDESNKVYLDGTQKGSVSDLTTSSLTYKILLFGMGTNSYTHGYVPSDWRIYYAKFTYKPTNTLVGHFIPVLDPNGVPCMYDLVTEKFFYNANTTGSFLYG